MAGAAGPAGGAGAPRNPVPVTRAATPAVPAWRWNLDSKLSITKRIKVVTNGWMDQRVDASIQAAVDEVVDSVAAPDQAGAGAWSWEASVNVITPRAFDQTTKQQIRAAFPAVPLGKLNAHWLKIWPDEVIRFALRNNAGAPVRTQDDEPIILWDYFSSVLAEIVWSVIEPHGLPPLSFIQIQRLSPTGDTVGDRILLFSKPAGAGAIEQLLAAWDDGNTSQESNDMFKQGSSIKVIIYNPSTGRGGGSDPFKAYPNLAGRCRTIYSAPVDDYCAPMAIAYFLATATDRRNLKRFSQRCRIAAQPLIDAVVARGGSSDGAWGYTDLALAAECIEENVRILVLHTVTFVQLFDTGDGPIEPDTPEQRTLYLLFDPGVAKPHYMLCLRPQSLLRHKVFCDQCKKLCKPDHLCSKHQCRYCRVQFASGELFAAHWNVELDECEKCCRRMPPGCKSKHETQCDGKRRRCPECNEHFICDGGPRGLTLEGHAAICGKGYKFCDNCYKWHHPIDDACAITPRDFSHNWDARNPDVWVGDIETMYDHTDVHKKQIPNLISLRKIPPFGKDDTKEGYTEALLQFYKDNPPTVFEGPDAMHLFCAFLIQVLTNSVIVFHNLRGFDGALIVNYLERALGIRIKKVMNGLKVMYAELKGGSIKLIDSLNFVTCRLAQMPKIVGVDLPGLTKGDFPHAFNTTANQKYAGAVPAPHYYGLDEDSDPELWAWYRRHARAHVPWTTERWVLQKELKLYCNQDTYILAMCWALFVFNMVKLMTVNPVRAVTAAGLTHKIVRTLSLPPEGIPTARTKEQADFYRTALYGGATNVYRPYVKCPPGWHVLGVDVKSMYPAVMLFAELPWGEPEVFPADAVPAYSVWKTWCGFVEVTVQPFAFDPDQPWRIPVLPSRNPDTGKLEFNLERKNKKLYMISELVQAVEKHGYKILEVHSAHKFQGRTDLYRKFMTRAIQLKEENGKPPRDVDAFCAAWAGIGVHLRREEVVKPENPGAKQVGKLTANTAWGKTGESDHGLQQTGGELELHRHLARHALGKEEFLGLDFEEFMPDTFTVHFRELEKPVNMMHRKTAVWIAAAVTSKAREWLMALIADPKIARWAVYCDTDCAWMLARNGTLLPPWRGWVPSDDPALRWGEHGVVYEPSDAVRERIANHVCVVGDWEPETAPGDEIEEWVALGPKLYAGRKREGEKKLIKMRTKGFPQTALFRKTVTFDSLRGVQLAGLRDLDDGTEELRVPYTKVRRQKAGGVYWGVENKRLRYDWRRSKGRLNPADPDDRLLPWGDDDERPTPQKRKAGGPPAIPLPKPVWKSRKIEAGDVDGLGLEQDDGMTLDEGESEAVTATAIAAQDARRTAAASTSIVGRLLQAVSEDLAE